METIHLAYLALIEVVERNVYTVEFPDLYGCMTQGDSLEDAVFKAQEALAIYYKEKGGNVPSPSSYETIKNHTSDSDTIIQLIAIDVNNYVVKSKISVKKTLTIPQWLNEISEKNNVNYSQILQKALIAYLRDLNTISDYDRKLLNE